jgi:integrase
VRTLGGVFKRGEVWYIVFTHRDRRYRESSGSPKKRVALALLRKRIAEVVEGRLMPSADRTSFDDLVRLIEADYGARGNKTTRDMLGRVKRLRESFGDARPTDVTFRDLQKHIAKREAAGAKPATIRHEITVFGRMLRLGVQAGLLKTVPPLPTITVNNVRQGFFEREALARVLERLPADLAPIIEFCSITGFRIGEARSLAWTQVDLQHGVIRLEPGTTKNKEGRTWPFALHPRLGALIREQRKRTDSLQRRLGTGHPAIPVIPWVFWREDGRGDGRQIREFRDSWKRACREAGVPGRYVHDFRRTAVRALLRAGVTEHIAMRLTGHKTSSMLKRYDIVSEADLRDAVAKLANAKHGAE